MRIVINRYDSDKDKMIKDTREIEGFNKKDLTDYLVFFSEEQFKNIKEILITRR